MPGKVRSTSDSRGSRYENVGGSGGSGTLSYMDVEPGALQRAIAGVSAEGDAVVFGRTSDGGAFSVRVLSDKQVFKWYPDSVDALHNVLYALAASD